MPQGSFDKYWRNPLFTKNFPKKQTLWAARSCAACCRLVFGFLRRARWFFAGPARAASGARRGSALFFPAAFVCRSARLARFASLPFFSAPLGSLGSLRSGVLELFFYELLFK
jgi:hypothetical protein